MAISATIKSFYAYFLSLPTQLFISPASEGNEGFIPRTLDKLRGKFIRLNCAIDS